MRLSHKVAGRVGEVRIGCSGWQYSHWRGDFYPAGLPQSQWFAHYAQSFDTVEINNSFYRLPSGETFAKWRAQAPAGFRYAVKASRYLTHMKRLIDPEAPLQRLFEVVRELGSSLGAILYQLPPNFAPDLERFERFLDAIRTVGSRTRLTQHAHHVVEFRDPRWYDERTYGLLERYRVAMCLHDMHGSSSPRMTTEPCAYVRFHFGTSKYGGRYPDSRLNDWAAWLAERIAERQDVYAYFNNDGGGHAPRDAMRLRDRLLTHVTRAAAS